MTKAREVCVVAVVLGLVFGLVGAVPQREGRQRIREDCATFDGGINMCSFDSHENMIDRLSKLARRNPELASVGSIGKSREGRDLAFIKISSNVNQRTLMEPMFKFVANMHGDETVGRQMLIYMAEYLINNYNHDPRVQKLVDSTEIYLLPSMNPDGFSRSTEGQCGGGGLFSLFRSSGRENAAGTDLNRDFPRQYEDQNKRGNALFQGKQPETVEMMRWILSNPFVLSANMHAGAVVASYPFDDTPSHRNGLYGESPDDKFFRHVAQIYANNNPVMRRGNNCGDNFPGGITNGAQWYDVPGGMQDFNYIHSNCFEITLELSCCKHPSSSTLVQEWLNNKESMLSYMEAVHLGVKGLVTDENGEPVPNATVRVLGINKAITTTDNGEYWRLLAPGKYQLVAEASGYLPSKPFTAQVQAGSSPIVHNFILQEQ